MLFEKHAIEMMFALAKYAKPMDYDVPSMEELYGDLMREKSVPDEVSAQLKMWFLDGRGVDAVVSLCYQALPDGGIARLIPPETVDGGDALTESLTCPASDVEIKFDAEFAYVIGRVYDKLYSQDDDEEKRNFASASSNT